MTPILVFVTMATATAAVPAAMPAPDTLRLEVGSPEVNALFFPAHRARNSVYIGDATTRR